MDGCAGFEGRGIIRIRLAFGFFLLGRGTWGFASLGRRRTGGGGVGGGGARGGCA